MLGIGGSKELVIKNRFSVIKIANTPKSIYKPRALTSLPPTPSSSAADLSKQMAAFKVLLLLKTLSREQINSPSFGVVQKCSTWKQLSCTEVLPIAAAALGKKQARSFWCLIRRCAATGISERSTISGSSHPASSPRDAYKVVLHFVSALSTLLERCM